MGALGADGRHRRRAAGRCDVEALDIEIGRVTARVGECDVSLSAEPVPRANWIAMVRYCAGHGPARAGGQGSLQSTHLDHLLAEDWGEQLIPRPGQIRRECTCDPSAACEHVAAVGLAFADAIDEDPSLLLRWRGCVDEPGPRSCHGDPWLGGAATRAGAATGVAGRSRAEAARSERDRVGDDDLADVLLPAYEAFAG